MTTINRRLQTSIGGLVLVIIAFVLIYFPAQQRTREMISFQAQLSVMADALGIAIGVALDGQSFKGMKLASEYVSKDEDAAWVVISTADGAVFAAYPPEAADRFRPDGAERAGEMSHRSIARIDQNGTPTHYVTIAKSLDHLNARIFQSQLTILAICSGLFVAALTFVRLIARRYSAPIEELSRAITKISDGKLDTRVHVSGNDELTVLARGFNEMVASLQSLGASVRESLNELNEVASCLSAAAVGMLEDLERQRSASDTIHEAAKQVGQTAIDIDSTADRLIESIGESSSSLEEMSASSQSVSENMQSLTSAIDGVSTSTTEMVAAVSLTAATMDMLSEGAKGADEIFSRMSIATHHIDRSARSSGASSNNVRDEATQGAKVVKSTISSIDEIQDCFSEIETSVDQLDEKMNAVGGAIQIISQITDQTSLLSLNASIIAAHAGNEGLGFGVVAEQIKMLSIQTATSAQKVAQSISEARQEAIRTKSAVVTGGSAVERGVDNSLEAGKSLELITEKSTNAAGRVSEIVESTEAQTRDTKALDSAMKNVGILAKQTSDATQEQKRSGAQISENLALIRNLGAETQHATDAQLIQGQQVIETVSRVSTQISEIAKASSSQVQRSESMSAAIGTVGSLLTEGERRAEACHEMVETLLERVRVLENAIGRLNS